MACWALGNRSALPYRQSFFESLLLLWVGFLMARPSRLELHLPAPEKLPHAVGVRVLDASLAQEPMSLRDRGYLAPFHGFLEFFKGFFCDQLLATAFVHPAFQQFFQTTLLVACKPPLALAPTVAQSVGSLSQVRAFCRLQEP